MQITADGFLPDPEGQLDWMSSIGTDEALTGFNTHRTDTRDTILMAAG